MYLADHHGQRIPADPTIRGATCPICNEPVIPKCGQINAHHWAHRADTDCDPWSEGETAWHTGWKQQWPAAKQEVRVGPHRADVLTATGVLEIQHSPISVEQIVERERFYAAFSPYGNLAWLFNMTDPLVRERIEITTPKSRRGTDYFSFRWKHARRSLTAIDGRLYLATAPEDGIIWHIRALYFHEDGKVRGWGLYLDYDEFIRSLDLVSPRPPKPVEQYGIDYDGDIWRRCPGTGNWDLIKRAAKGAA